MENYQDELLTDEFESEIEREIIFERENDIVDLIVQQDIIDSQRMNEVELRFLGKILLLAFLINILVLL